MRALFVHYLAILLLSVNSFCQTAYEFKNLGSFGGTWTEPKGISNQKIIVGWGFDLEFNSHPFFWKDGEFKEIYALGLNNAVECISSNGRYIFISATKNNFKYIYRKDLNSNKFVIQIKVKFPEVFDLSACNNFGAAVGTISNYGKYPIPTTPVLLANRKIIRLKTLSENSGTITSINNSSRMVGYSFSSLLNKTVSVEYRINNTPELIYTDGVESKAVDINDRGEILIQTSENQGAIKGKVFSPDGSIYNVKSPSETYFLPLQINNASEVIGTSICESGYLCKISASLNNFTDLTKKVLEDHNYGIEKITAINDSGDLVGVFFRDIGGERFFSAGLLMRR